jgi:protein-S-isoprenylcysteine O-methyltransferase Ste14
MWQALFAAPWLAFAGWWLFRAFGTARTERQESGRQRATHGVLLVAGTLFLVAPPHALRHRLWPPSLPLACVALSFEIAGVAFAIWAREHLGRLWSGRVTLKEDHRVVQSGPYRFARHPIYTGILVAIVGDVMVRADLGALVGLALFIAGFARKILIEEAMLAERFGAEYAAYRTRVRAIIPFVL